MTREEKYKDTDTFHFYNANPKGRYTTDCVIRAITKATGKDYCDVVMEMAKLQCEVGYDDGDKKAIELYLAKNGWAKQKQPRKRDNAKYTGAEFCKKLTREHFEGNVIANIGGHHIVCIAVQFHKHKVFDTWDSTNKSIGNYWIKKGDTL